MLGTNINVRDSAQLDPCGDPSHEDCGLRNILDRLGERWTVMTLAELTSGSRRYREIERALPGISQRMLTLTLRRLERDGYILRHVKGTVPPEVSYELSELGHSFAKQVASVMVWSRKQKAAIDSAREQYDARHSSTLKQK